MFLRCRLDDLIRIYNSGLYELYSLYDLMASSQLIPEACGKHCSHLLEEESRPGEVKDLPEGEHLMVIPAAHISEHVCVGHCVNNFACILATTL